MAKLGIQINGSKEETTMNVTKLPISEAIQTLAVESVVDSDNSQNLVK